MHLLEILFANQIFNNKSTYGSPTYYSNEGILRYFFEYSSQEELDTSLKERLS